MKHCNFIVASIVCAYTSDMHALNYWSSLRMRRFVGFLERDFESLYFYDVV